MRTGRFAAAATLATLMSSNGAFAANIIYDSNKCALIGNPSDRATAIEWTGDCVNGLISGDGTLLLMAGNNVWWKYTLNETAGAIAGQGYIVPTVDEKRVRYDMSECQLSKRGTFAVVVTPGTVKVWVPRQWELTNEFVRFELTKMAFNKIDAECPLSEADRGSGYRVVVYREGGSYPDDRYFEYEVYGAPFREWSERAREQTRVMESVVRDLNQSRKEEAAAAERAAERAASLELYESFSASAGVDQLVLDDTLHNNPFAYDGKRIAAPATFLEMLSRDSALFYLNNDVVLLGNVSASDFTNGEELVLVAISGLEKEQMRLNRMGDRFVVTATLDAFARCSQKRCTEYTSWMN